MLSFDSPANLFLKVIGTSLIFMPFLCAKYSNSIRNPKPSVVFVKSIFFNVPVFMHLYEPFGSFIPVNGSVSSDDT